MPAYDYRCRTCDAAFEVSRSITAPPAGPPSCPQGHQETTRVFSPVAVGVGAVAGRADAGPAGGGGCCGGGCCGT